MKNPETVIAFTGGGTGGHIYPGLAVVSCLKNRLPCRIIWIGSNKGIDRSIIEKAGLEFYGIPSGKFRRSFSLKNLTDIFNIAAGFFAARKILRKEKPALLFSKGGFVSVPPSAAAASLGIPVFSHESDLTPGLATKINLRFSKRLFIPYDESMKFYRPKAQKKITVSGNPVRPEFHNADSSRGRAFLNINEGDSILLVLGGSMGSLEINNLIKGCLPDLIRHYVVVHQGGSGYGEFRAGSRYKPYPYFDDEMPHIVAAADLVICRGGAGTLWECAALRKPMIIIPLRTGSRGDQVENAEIFENAGAAINLSEDITAEKLSFLVCSLAADKVKREAMAAANTIKTGAAELIAEKIIEKVRN